MIKIFFRYFLSFCSRNEVASQKCNCNQICFANSLLCEYPSSYGEVENGLENDLTLQDTSQKIPVCSAGLGFSLSICCSMCLFSPDGRITEPQPLAAWCCTCFRPHRWITLLLLTVRERPVGVLSLLICLVYKSGILLFEKKIIKSLLHFLQPSVHPIPLLCNFCVQQQLFTTELESKKQFSSLFFTSLLTSRAKIELLGLLAQFGLRKIRKWLNKEQNSKTLLETKTRQ